MSADRGELNSGHCDSTFTRQISLGRRIKGTSQIRRLYCWPSGLCVSALRESDVVCLLLQQQAPLCNSCCAHNTVEDVNSQRLQQKIQYQKQIAGVTLISSRKDWSWHYTFVPYTLQVLTEVILTSEYTNEKLTVGYIKGIQTGNKAHLCTWFCPLLPN